MGDDPDMSQIQTMSAESCKEKIGVAFKRKTSARLMAMSASTSKDMNMDVASLTSYVVVRVAASLLSAFSFSAFSLD
jgi:hypothetical protein